MIHLVIPVLFSKDCSLDADNRNDFSTPADDEAKEKLRREEEEKKRR